MYMAGPALRGSHFSSDIEYSRQLKTSRSGICTDRAVVTVRHIDNLLSVFCTFGECIEGKYNGPQLS